MLDFTIDCNFLGRTWRLYFSIYQFVSQVISKFILSVCFHYSVDGLENVMSELFW